MNLFQEEALKYTIINHLMLLIIITRHGAIVRATTMRSIARKRRLDDVLAAKILSTKVPPTSPILKETRENSVNFTDQYSLS